ncbi:asparaginase [Microbacterium sp. ZW T5_56]|uniref:asparaginase n=1 Tax=Microbacterium sp. ZW T5_56 TaxID=3378081 RepID=UPI00385423FA
MIETFGVQDAVELAVVDRNGFVESRHAGAAIVLAPNGEVRGSFGRTDALILPRSTMKPLQALASLTAGAQLAGEQLAISTASHVGTDLHVEVVTEMLLGGGLRPSDLECPASWPADSATRDNMIRRGEEVSPLRMACSGKHATMLLACRASGWETAGYTDPSHPLQAHARDVIERLVGEKMQITTIDGCGAPVYAMTLAGLARAIQRVGTASERSPFALYRLAGELMRAVRENPWTIEGPGRPDSSLVEKLGVYSKFGAEGVQTMVAPDGTTVVVKTLDGSTRAGHTVAVHLLGQAGALTATQVAEADTLLGLDVRGGGRPVGHIRSTVHL